MWAQSTCQLPSAQLKHCICIYTFHFISFFLLQVAAVDFPEDVGPIDLSTATSTTRALHTYIYIHFISFFCCSGFSREWWHNRFVNCHQHSTIRALHMYIYFHFFLFSVVGGGSRFSRGWWHNWFVNCHQHNSSIAYVNTCIHFFSFFCCRWRQ